MKKILLTLILGIFLISLASAEIQTLGTFQQGKDINLIQTCANCTFNNITSIMGSNSQQIIGNFPMTKTGSVYNFTLTSGNTTQLGEYIVNGFGDLNGIDTVWNYNLFVTPSGNSGNANIVFFILIIFLLYGINLLGFFNENVMMTVLGGMALIFLGVYMVNNGIIIYRDNLTNYVAYVTIAWGGMSSVFALYKEYFGD